MTNIAVLDVHGVLHLPASMLDEIGPPKHYTVEIREGQIVLDPVRESLSYWEVASPEERAEERRRWAASHDDGPGLPDAALTRERIYEE